ncbi:MAG: DUF1249 domain-containing protein [Algiphilus sp.]|nr:DUF1249 domain-containing protein [Algiphilus sp.]
MASRVITPATSLGALHVLYERGFQLAQQLVPELDLPFVSAVSEVEGEPPLYLSTIARDRYTSCFRLTYEIDGIYTPDLHIKVYRDARVAEALQCTNRPPWLAADEADPEALHFLSAQWRRNAMMVKWLAYLLERGHGFVHAARPREKLPRS